MDTQIKHSGTIESISDDCVKVRIIQQEACSACKVAAHCNASGAKMKIVDVYNADTNGLKVGQAVTVTARRAVGMRAVALAFGIPFMVLLIVIFGVSYLTGNETLAALCGLLSLVPYYFLIYLFRNKIREQMSFYIEN